MTTTNDTAKAALKPRPLTADEVTFTIECLEEHIAVRGNFMATDDPEQDKRDEDEVLRRLNQGDLWAWCCVKVTAHWAGLHGTDFLGCCSYQDEADFERGGYAADMRERALDELNQRIARDAERLSPLFQEAIERARAIIADDLEDDPDRVEDASDAYQLAVLLLGDPRANG